MVAESEALKGEEGEHYSTSDLSREIFKEIYFSILRNTFECNAADDDGNGVCWWRKRIMIGSPDLSHQH